MQRKGAKRGHWPKGKKRGPMSDEHRRGIGESVRRARVHREELECLEAELKLSVERIKELEKRLAALEEGYKARTKPTRRRLSEASAT